MEPGRVWDETPWRFHCGSEEEGDRKVSGTTNRRGGQNFSIERILGQVRSAHLGEGGEEGQEVDQGEEGNDDGQGDGEGEGDIEEEDEEDEEGDEVINNQYQHLRREQANLHLGLSPSSQANSSNEEGDEIINNQDHHLNKEHANLHLRLSPSSQASSTSRVQPILPRPPHLAAPPLNFCPKPSLLSQDPFLLSPLQSPR